MAAIISDILSVQCLQNKIKYEYRKNKITMEKKLYVKPQAKVIELDFEAIIAQSTDSQKSTRLNSYEGVEWSDD